MFNGFTAKNHIKFFIGKRQVVYIRWNGFNMKIASAILQAFADKSVEVTSALKIFRTRLAVYPSAPPISAKVLKLYWFNAFNMDFVTIYLAMQLVDPLEER